MTARRSQRRSCSPSAPSRLAATTRERSPAGTPEAVLRRLSEASAAALRAPEMQPRLAAMALTVEAQPLARCPAYLRAEGDTWRDVVRARNIRVQ